MSNARIRRKRAKKQANTIKRLLNGEVVKIPLKRTKFRWIEGIEDE